jgi:UDP-N-acetylglucosamine 2-epimerase (non-hydrolysing)
LDKLFSGNWKKGSIPVLWDGKAAERIIDHILNIFEKTPHLAPRTPHQ